MIVSVVSDIEHYEVPSFCIRHCELQVDFNCKLLRKPEFLSLTKNWNSTPFDALVLTALPFGQFIQLCLRQK